MECEISHLEIHNLNIVYNGVPTTQENIKVRILIACASINSEMTERARKSFKYRLQKCIEVRGHHFEHLFKYIFCQNKV
ncbi:hypothetical protein ALC56_03139 [Trachymyrmex septentrionalis]|uniref:Mos1 transposase HTH domain-containing protein n=1 Tax=Trachymyrmex septentrionalis TaxID=34720 RepID=A0A151JZJ3_9HYME|nr:hypothetical protein ALC56_03139 [Trachymyrmex septentrionalis]